MIIIQIHVKMQRRASFLLAWLYLVELQKLQTLTQTPLLLVAVAKVSLVLYNIMPAEPLELSVASFEGKIRHEYAWDSARQKPPWGSKSWG